VISKQIKQLKIGKNSTRINPCSPSSSVEMDSVDSDSFVKHHPIPSEPRKERLNSEGGKLSKHEHIDLGLNYPNLDNCKHPTPIWSNISVSDIVSSVDIDVVETPEDESVQSDRKRTVPNYSRKTYYEKIEEDKDDSKVRFELFKFNYNRFWGFNFEYLKVSDRSENVMEENEEYYSSPSKPQRNIKNFEHQRVGSIWQPRNWKISFAKTANLTKQHSFSASKNMKKLNKHWITPLKKVYSFSNRKPIKTQLPKCLNSYIYYVDKDKSSVFIKC
jgi:hypothetical protein